MVVLGSWSLLNIIIQGTGRTFFLYCVNVHSLIIQSFYCYNFRNTIDSKYKELHDREKPNFPHGERSINDMFPSMKEAAALQNQQQETEENPKGILEDSLHEKGP